MGAEGVKGFPATWIFNADVEIFRDDGRVLEAVLSGAGGRVKREVMLGLPHYFWCFPLWEKGREFWERVLGGVRWVLEG